MAQDSSRADFWDIRYQNAVTPWELEGLPERFMTESSTLLASGLRRVLLPGCGNAVELQALSAMGASPLAIDFSPEAIARAKAANPGLSEQILLQDFFSADLSGGWQWVYERAFLCALPPAMRVAYASQMSRLIPAGGVLAGYFFLADKDRGPPFGISLEALSALLSPAFELEQCTALHASLPVFSPHEYWMTWRKL